MSLLYFIRFTIIIATVVDAIFLQVKPEAHEKYQQICKNVTSKANFRQNIVAGKTWRIYYTWNIKLDAECADVSFKYANDMIIDRIWKDMNGYLVTQPEWKEAVLLMSIGKNREVLLFEDKSGIPGEFLGVPNMKAEQVIDIDKDKMQVRLFKIVMKLLYKGNYLLSSDCRVGVTTLAVVPGINRPKRADIDAVAATMNFGDGFHACIEEPDPEEDD